MYRNKQKNLPSQNYKETKHKLDSKENGINELTGLLTRLNRLIKNLATHLKKIGKDGNRKRRAKKILRLNRLKIHRRRIQQNLKMTQFLNDSGWRKIRKDVQATFDAADKESLKTEE